MSCGVGCRCGSELMLLWLWCRPAEVAPIRPLAWEPPYAKSVALKGQKRQDKNKTKQKNRNVSTAFSHLKLRSINSIG